MRNVYLNTFNSPTGRGQIHIGSSSTKMNVVDQNGNPHQKLNVGDALHLEFYHTKRGDAGDMNSKAVTVIVLGVESEIDPNWNNQGEVITYKYDSDIRIPNSGSENDYEVLVGLPEDASELGNDFGKLYAGGTLLFDATSSGGIDLPEDDDYCTIIQAKPEYVGQRVRLPVEPGSRIDLGDGQFVAVDDLKPGPWDNTRMEEQAILKGTKVRICGSFDATQAMEWAGWVNDIEAFRHYDYFTGRLDEGRVTSVNKLIFGFTGTRYSALDSPVYFPQVAKGVQDINYAFVMREGYDLNAAFSQSYMNPGQPHNNNWNQSLDNALGWLNGEPIIDTSMMFASAASFNQPLNWMHTLGYGSNTMFQNALSMRQSMRRVCAEHIPSEPYGWGSYQDENYQQINIEFERPFWGAPC